LIHPWPSVGGRRDERRKTKRRLFREKGRTWSKIRAGTRPGIQSSRRLLLGLKGKRIHERGRSSRGPAISLRKRYLHLVHIRYTANWRKTRENGITQGHEIISRQGSVQLFSSPVLSKGTKKEARDVQGTN